MDAVTYPDEQVVKFFQTHLIPLRVPHNHEPLAKEFDVKWTPTLVVLDPAGHEHTRGVGFLGPDELIPWLMLGIGKTHFDAEHFQEALVVLDELLAQHAQSPSAPEAVYVRGVTQYKSTQDPKPLRAAYDKLSAEYPLSEWTKRAAPYRLIG